MAQTRAIGRALRAPLGQIVVLAGYEPRRRRRCRCSTRSRPDIAARIADPIPDALKPTETRSPLIRCSTELSGAPRRRLGARAREIAGVPGDMLTKTR